MVDADKEDIEPRKDIMFTSINARSANAYKRLSVQAGVDQANPHQLVELLFDGLVNNIGAARSALARNDIKGKCESIVKSVRILEEGLKGSLNVQEGGEIATNLQRIYDYCVLRLTQANLRNDDALLQEVLSVLAPIADGWKQIGTKGTAVGGSH
jgi:flagellar protein FliS